MTKNPQPVTKLARCGREGPLFDNEYSDCILIRNVQIDAEGRLSENTISLAQELSIPHATTKAVEDEGNVQPEEGVTPPLFMFSQQPVCECAKCIALLSRKRRLAMERDGQQQSSLKKTKLGMGPESIRRTPKEAVVIT